MRSSSPARWLAPLALAGALVALIVVASSGGSSGGDGSGPTNTVSGTGGQATHVARTTATTTNTLTPKTTAKTYIVKPGDVLSAIAVKTGVPLSQIEQLNPDVDAQSLHAGQKLKLAP